MLQATVEALLQQLQAALRQASNARQQANAVAPVDMNQDADSSASTMFVSSDRTIEGHERCHSS